MGRMVFLIIVLLFISSSAFASPLMDYSAGKGSIDLIWRDAQNTTSSDSISVDWNKKYNFDGTLTLGLGNNFAVQYRNFEPKSATTDINTGFSTDSCYEQFKINEINVLYKLNQNVAVLGGWITGKEYITDVTNPMQNYTSDTKHILQGGVVASTKIAPNITLWGDVAAGSKFNSYGVGIGYEFSPGWELNADYQTMDAKSSDIELKTKGLGFGVTYKF